MLPVHKASLLPGLLVALRIVAALVLIFHPSFDSSEELDGWDVARFQQIADSGGQAYVDYDAEYPPGSLVVISVVSGLDDGPNRVVTTHRVIVVLALLVDLVLTLLLYWSWGRPVATVYLVLGTPLIFFGLVRFDLLATLLAVFAAATVSRSNSSPSSRLTSRPWILELAGAVTIAAGALVKVWPAILILGAFATGRRRLATTATVGCLLAGVAWVAISGSQAPLQVLSLRGATGWHIESVAGSVTALLTNQTSALEANAYRIGTMNAAVVQLSRTAALMVMLGLAWLGSRSRTEQRFALVVLGSLAALILSAPLLSPQFLLWLTPWAAMLCWPSNSRSTNSPNQLTNRRPQHQTILMSATLLTAILMSAILLTAIAVSLTVLVHVTAGPANLDQAVPALVLLGRDVTLLALVVVCGLALHRGDRPSAGREHPLGSDRPGPRTATAQPKIDQVA